MFDFLFSNGKPWFNPQNEVGNRGLIKQIRAMDNSSGEMAADGLFEPEAERLDQRSGLWRRL
jgi:hypothetical protein